MKSTKENAGSREDKGRYVDCMVCLMFVSEIIVLSK
jgi:hypothetical protein